MRSPRSTLWPSIAAACMVGMAQSQESGYSGSRLIRESDYREKVRGMWLGQCIANWTGLQTEGRHRQPPFLTDASWGQVQPYTNGFPLDFKWFFNPWGADDDTDIEYVYNHLMVQHDTTLLTPQQIVDGWTAHINRSIWVSNLKARNLMARGVMPPVTGMGCANVDRLEIDAQLTTEFFGMFCPGAPGRGLELADMPILVASSGYASHAAQFYAVLYALATQVPTGLSGRDQAVWLTREARRFIPDSSKSADVIDVVLADFFANPDVNDWERTRDLVDQRYRVNAAANGFVYRDWFESSVNLAGGVIALLYGQMDYRRTVQIGTMSGWDSDNGTATMGGLLGLVHGFAHVQAQFPGTVRDNFWILRTRDNMPDYTGPGDTWEDTFALLADRTMPLIRRGVEESGGLVDAAGGVWLLPPVSSDPALAASPRWREDARSMNNAVRRAGGVVTAAALAGPNNNAPPANRGVAAAAAFANGVETKFDGREENDADRWYYTSQGTGPAASVTLTVTYDRDVVIDTIRFIEGDHFADGTGNGGNFTTLAFEVRIGGVWTAAVGTAPPSPDAARPFEMLNFVLASPTSISGIRVSGAPGGTGAFITCAELDGLSPAPATARQTFDLNGDGTLGIEDLHAWEAAPRDLDGNAAADATDRAYLELAIRWRERADLTAER